MVSRQSGRDQIHIRYNTEVAESALLHDLDLNFLDDLAAGLTPDTRNLTPI